MCTYVRFAYLVATNRLSRPKIPALRQKVNTVAELIVESILVIIVSVNRCISIGRHENENKARPTKRAMNFY